MRSLLAVLRPLVLRPLLHEKSRTLLTILGIAVGVAVLIAIHLSNQSALRSFGESVDAMAGEADWQLVPEAGVMNESILLPLQRIWSSGGRFAPVIDADGVLLPSQTPVRFLAVDLMSDLHFRDYDYATIATSDDGTEEDLAPFLSLFDDGSVVLPAALAGQHGLRVGDRMRIELGGRQATFTVRGILRPRGPATAFNGSIVVADLAVAQQRFPSLRGKLTRVDISLPETNEERIMEEIRGLLPDGIRLERPSQAGARVDRMLQAFRVNLFALAGVALLVGVYLVYNTVLISILRRREQVGILKTLGVTPRQIFAAFLLEGALLGMFGGAAGVAMGWAMARVTLEMIGRTVNALYVQSDPAAIVLGPELVIAGICLGTLVAAAAAIQPAIEAASVRPGALIRQALYQRLPRTTVMRLFAGALLLFLLGAAATRIPATERIAVGGYLSVFLLVGGFSLLAPAVLTLAADLLRRPTAALFGVPGRLAVAGVTASLRRTAIAAAALSVAIAMMIAILVMVGSFRETVRIWVDQTVRSDLWLRPARGLQDAPAAVFPPSIATDVTALPFVRAVDPVRSRQLIFRDELITLSSIDLRTTLHLSSIPMVTPDARTALTTALRDDAVLISESLAIHHDIAIGEPIEIPTPSGVRNFAVAGIYRDYSSDRGAVMMDRQLYVTLWSDASINTLAVYLREGVDVETARRELESQLAARYRIFTASNAVIRTEVMRIFDQTFLVTWSLLAIALFVAVVGIVNTLSALLMERRAEITLIRILGMSQRQTRMMVVLESAVIGLVSIVVGVMSGAAMSWVLIYVINVQSFGWTIALHPPWSLLLASLVVTVAATTLAGFLPGRFGKRDVLRAE